MQLNFNYLVNFCLLEFAVPEMMPMVMTGRKRKGYLHSAQHNPPFYFQKICAPNEEIFPENCTQDLKAF